MTKITKIIASISFFLILSHNGSVSATCQVTQEKKSGSVICSKTSLEDSFYYTYDALYHPELTLTNIDQLQITYFNISILDQVYIPYTIPLEFGALSVNFCGLKNISAHAFDNVKVEKLNLAFNDIQSLNFLAHLPEGIKELDLSHNKIEHVNFQMIKITLNVLNLSFNKLTNVKFEAPSSEEMFIFPVIGYLDLSHNTELSSIDFKEFVIDMLEINLQHTNLKEIRNHVNGSHQMIGSLTLSNTTLNHTLLEDLNLHFSSNGAFNASNCSLQRIMTGIYFDGLVSFNIDFSHNNISVLDASVLHPNSMYEKVDFSHNRIQYFNGTLNFNYITELNLAYNEIIKLGPQVFGKFTEIFRLNLSHNPLQLTDFNIKRLGKLNTLDLSYCGLNDLPELVFAEIKGLKVLNLENNLLDNLSALIFRPLTTIKEIKLSYNKLAVLPTGLFETLTVRNIQICDNDLTKIEPKAFNALPNLARLSINNNRKALEISDQAFYNLGNLGISISLKKSNLVKFSLKAFEKMPNSLIYLDIRGNALTEIAPNRAINLQQLNISFNGSIPPKAFIGLDTLLELTISDSNITSIQNRAFQGLYQLEQLTTKNTYVHNLENGALDGLFKLRWLDAKEIFSQKPIASYMFKDFYALESLNLSNISLKSIESYAFKGLYRLSLMNLSYCNISVISAAAFDGPKELSLLDLSYNALSSLEHKHFVGLSNLKTLNVSHNKINDIEIGALQYFPKLLRLDLSYNNLTEFKVGTFSNLKSLEMLELQRNSISNLLFETFFPLESLVNLNLEFNNLKTIEHLPLVSNLKRLEHIGIAKNKWKCEFLGDMLITLKKYSIDYSSENVNYTDDNINGVECIDICKYLWCKDSRPWN